MLKIGIVDDQQLYLDKIEDILVNNYDDIKVFKYNSVSEIEQDIDFLLLDIDMPDEDGIKFSKTHQDIKIVFVTNYDTRIKEAFGPNIYGYVSKSKLKEELIEKVNELIQVIKNNYIVTFKVNGIDVNIRIDDIIYCQYIGSHRVIITCESKGEITINAISLKEIINKLDERFIDITRDIVINSNKIIDFVAKYVYLNGVDNKFEVSVRKRSTVRKIFYEGYK